MESARRHGISTAIIAIPRSPRSRVAIVTERCSRHFRHVITLPDAVGMTNIWLEVRDFEGYLGLSMDQKLMSRLNRAIKRVLELAVTILAAIVAVPLFAILAIAIKLDSPGPVFYGHRRLGRNEEEFTAWKFRTMRVGADEALANHLRDNPAACREWEEKHKLKDDPRVTRVGRFLRVSSLDELPQLWNILRGEMSLVGPRPIVRDEVVKYGAVWSTVSAATPGLTGLWQVSGRSDRSYEERRELDLYYLRNWSPWLDLFILFKTAWILLTSKGAC
jgi:Undecaprenyl-phosphate galactose phosphotransferase WbaP